MRNFHPSPSFFQHAGPKAGCLQGSRVGAPNPVTPSLTSAGCVSGPGGRFPLNPGGRTGRGNSLLAWGPGWACTAC